jgi:flagellar hook-associated protein 3 FlgL
MRIADKMNFDQVNSGLQKNRSELSELQNQAATQKRVNKPSDDPLATTRVLSARTNIHASQQYIKNINQAKTFLEYSDQSLSELTEILTRAKELAISQASDGGANASSRAVTATEVEQLVGQTVQVGNRKLGDRFLFGGYRTTEAPFDPQGGYRGDAGEMKVAINKEADVSINVPGSRVFLGLGIRGGTGNRASGSSDGAVSPAGSEAGAPNYQAPLRGPAGGDPPQAATSQIAASWRNSGTNVFSVLQDLEVSLRTNFKEGIQDSLDKLDEALAQVVLARSEVGSRLATLNSATENLTKGVVDSKALASSMEDVDTFELVSNLTKSESTLKASLDSSSKLIQPSLLDFLR